MISVRLPEELEDKLNKLAEIEDLTKTDIVNNALENYINEREQKLKPYELGKDLFGSAGTGDKNSSINYKNEVGEKISEKYSKLNN